METSNSFSIDFITRKCKADQKQVLIYARITVNGEVKEISIKEKIDANAWNPAAEMVNGKTIEIKKLTTPLITSVSGSKKNTGSWRIKEY